MSPTCESVPPFLSHIHCGLLDSCRAWCLLILLQSYQKLPEPLLPRSTRSALRTLPTQIHQLSDSFPACPTRRRILSICQEFLCLFPRLRNRLVFFRIVVLIEVINGCLCAFNRLGLFLLGSFGTVLEG